MAAHHIRPDWTIPERETVAEDAWLAFSTDRRAFLRRLGLGAVGAAAALSGLPALARARGRDPKGRAEPLPGMEDPTTGGPLGPKCVPPSPNTYPAARNPAYTVDGELTPELTAARYNNFYEFSTDKEKVWQLAKDYDFGNWWITVTGLVERPLKLDLQDIYAFPHEERVYRHRCVEAWSMKVPWTGFPLSLLLDRAVPKSSAKYVRFLCIDDKEGLVGQKTQGWYPWPYHEGLTIEEARNELTLVTTGIFGHALPKQHGYPIRVVVPWKYGYKGSKSVVGIELVPTRPKTFWNEVAPDEYDFWSNVNPEKPHPRWSQATEIDIGTNERIPTRLYNGYERQVAHLYA